MKSRSVLLFQVASSQQKIGAALFASLMNGGTGNRRQGALGKFDVGEELIDCLENVGRDFVLRLLSDKV